MKYIILIGLILLFSGCGSTLMFTQGYIDGKLKNDLNKVSKDVKVVINPSETSILKKRPNSFKGKLTSISINLENVNTGVLNGFLTQYFDNVEKLNELNLNEFTIKSKILDYEYSYGIISKVYMKVYMNIEVSYQNKILLNKKYESNEKSVNVINSFTRLSGESYAEELFHKAILEVYETEFKEDFLKILKNNN